MNLKRGGEFRPEKGAKKEVQRPKGIFEMILMKDKEF